MTVGANWTEERIDTLKRLCSEGFSASQIAAELGGGLTRNAVIGKLHRLGLKKPTASFAPAKRTRPVSRPKPPPPAIAARPAAPAVIPEPPIPPAQLPDAPEPKRLRVLQLTERTCKWPIGDPRRLDFCFCGNEAARGGPPYCHYHAGIAYQPREPRRRAAA